MHLPSSLPALSIKTNHYKTDVISSHTYPVDTGLYQNCNQ